MFASRRFENGRMHTTRCLCVTQLWYGVGDKFESGNYVHQQKHEATL